MKSALRFTILLSLLLHLLVMLPWLLNVDSNVEEPAAKQTTIEVALEPDIQTPPPPKADPPSEVAEATPPPPMHLEDDKTQANLSNGTAETQPSSQQPPDQGNQQSKSPTKEGDAVVQKDSPEPEQLNAPEIVRSNSPHLSDFLNAQKTKQALNKQGLDLQTAQTNTQGKQAEQSTLEQEQEERARWYNEVLKRITEQVNYVWVKPQGISINTWGVIRLKIDQNGYLEEAWVHLPSGNAQLDRSALRAINQVFRYDIPQSEQLSRYYRHLEFRYNGEG